MDSNVNKALSLFFIIDTTPTINPATPITAISGVGRGSLINIAKADSFNDINTIKSRVKIAAHFPVFALEQSWIFMFYFHSFYYSV